MALQVEIVPEWSGYEVWDIVLTVCLILVTGVFATLVYFQVRHERKAFDSHNEELSQKNRVETFNQVDRYREYVFHQHQIIDKLFKNEVIVTIKDDDYHISSDYVEIEELLDDIEVFALKQDKLKLDMTIIFSILGRTILKVYDNQHVQYVIRDIRDRYQDESIYSNLEKLIAQLQIISNMKDEA